MKKTLTILLLLLVLVVHSQDSVHLKLHYQKGDEYVTTITTKSGNSIASSETRYIKTSVKDSTANGYIVNLTIDRITMKANNNGKTVNYDSSVDEAKMSSDAKGLHSRFKPALNTVISENVSRSGISSKRKKVSGSLNAQMASQKTNLIQLPKAQVSLNSQWSQQVKNGNIQILYTYLITEITPTKVIVECYGEPQGVLTGSVKGVIDIDTKTGIPVKKQMKINLNFNGQILKSDVIITTQKI